MRSVFLLVLMLNFVPRVQAELAASLEVGSVYQSNPLYLDSNKESATATEINPSLQWRIETKKAYADLDLQLQHYQLSAFPNANRTNHQAELAFGLGNLKRRFLGLYMKSEAITNPLDNPVGAPVPPRFDEQGAGLVSELRLGKKIDLYLRAEATQSQVNVAALDYLAADRARAWLGLRYRFLPETYFYTELIGEEGKFAQGLDNQGNVDENIARQIKFDYETKGINFGIRGKLTKYTKVDASFGIRDIRYKDGNEFGEPVFSFVFEDQITPKDSLIAGYIYSVRDSSFSNWVLEQDMKIGYAKIINDRFLFLLKMSYIYYSYSEPQRREDQRLFANLQLDYVVFPGWTLVTKLNMDVLVSDAYDLDPAQASASFGDLPASYEAADFGLYIKRSF